MLGKSHMKIALGVTLFTANPDIILGALIGSLLPDVDQQNTYLGRCNIFLKSKKVRKFVQHRGVTHSLFGTAVLITILKLALNTPSVMGISIGIITHLIADAFTPSGIQLFWLPFESMEERKSKNVTLGHIKTGSRAEWVISTFILLIGIVIGLIVFIILVRSRRNV